MQKNPAKDPTIPLLDIHQVAYLGLHGHKPCLTKSGTRVVFEFPNTPPILDLLQEYNENPPVKLLDYVSLLRSLRAQMYAAR